MPATFRTSICLELRVLRLGLTEFNVALSRVFIELAPAVLALNSIVTVQLILHLHLHLSLSSAHHASTHTAPTLHIVSVVSRSAEAFP